MLPTISVLGINIGLYGLFSMIGIGLGILLARYRSRYYVINKIDITFSAVYGGIGLVIGAKVLYIITIIPILQKNWPQITEEPRLLIPILTQGMVFYGGLIGTLFGLYLYSKQYGISYKKLLETFAPSLPLVHGFGRIGCHFAGCCYGINYEGPFHVTFYKSLVAPIGINLFPVQLVESGFNLVASLILYYIGKVFNYKISLLGIYFLIYSSVRFLLEQFRGDEIRGSFLALSTSSWISIGIFCVGMIMTVKSYRMYRKEI